MKIDKVKTITYEIKEYCCKPFIELHNKGLIKFNEFNGEFYFMRTYDTCLKLNYCPFCGKLIDK